MRVRQGEKRKKDTERERKKVCVCMDMCMEGEMYRNKERNETYCLPVLKMNGAIKMQSSTLSPN